MIFLRSLVVAALVWFTGSTGAFAMPFLAPIFPAALAFLGSPIGQLIIGIGASVISGLIKGALNKKKDTQQGVKLSVQFGDAIAQSFGAGYWATAGSLKYRGTWGTVNKTPNAYLVDVIQLSDFPIGSTFPGAFGGNEKLTFGGAPHATLGYPVTNNAFRGEGGKTLMWMKFYDGTQAAADAYLVDKFASSGRPWDSTAIGTGCPYVIVTMLYDREVYQQGKPDFLFEPPARKFYDLRKDGSVGGSGTHRWNNPATWEVSSNPVVIIYNIVRGIYYGSEWVYGGRNLPAFRLPFAMWATAANECDREITLSGGGTEPQFRCGMEISIDREPISVIQSLLMTCSGRMSEIGGIFEIMVGAPGAAVYSFTDADITITKGQSYSSFPGLQGAYNGIEARYPDPSEKWQLKDAPARYNSTWETQDGGRRLASGIVFEALPYRRQVQRVMRTMIYDNRRERVHSFFLPPTAYVLTGTCVVSWTSAANGYSNKKFLVEKASGQAGMFQEVILKEIDPSDYDWSTGDELPTDIVNPIIIRPPVQALQAFGVTPAIAVDNLGRNRRPTIRLQWDNDLDEIRAVRAQVRLKDTTAIIYTVDFPYVEPHYGLFPGDFIPNTDYQVQAWLRPFSGRPTSKTTWLDVKTPNVQMISDDILDGAIIRDKIAAAAIDAGKLADAAVTSLKLADAAVTEAKVAVGAISSGKLADGSVINSKLAALAVEAANLAANSVTTTKIADDAITTPKLITGAVVARTIGAGEVIASKLTLTDMSNVFPDYNMLDPAMYSVVAGSSGFTFFDGINEAVGRYYLSINSGTDLTTVATQWFQVETSTDYRVEIGYGSNTTGGAAAVVSIEYGSVAAGGVVTSLGVTELFRRTANTTLRFGANTTSPSTGRVARLRFTREAAAAPSVGRFGGLVMRRRSNASLIVDGAIIAGKIAAGTIVAADIAAGTITGDKIAANTISATSLVADSITARELVLTNFTNLFPNGYFGYDSLAGLTISSNVTTYSQAAGGGGAIVSSPSPFGIVFGGVTTTEQAYVANIPVAPGDYHHMQFDYSSGGGAPRVQPMQIRVSYFGGDGVQIGSTSAQSVTATAVTWNTFVRANSGQAPAGAARMRVDIRRVGDAGNTGVGYVTNIMVRNRASADLIVDGAITAGKIAANAVVAGTIDAGAINTSSLMVDGVVITAKILANNVTKQAIAITAGNLVVTSIASPGITAQTTSINALGFGAVLVQYGLNVEASAGAGRIVSLTIRKNSSVVRTITFFKSNDSTISNYNFFYLDNDPSNGTDTWTMNVWCSGASDVTVSQRSIVLTGLMR